MKKIKKPHKCENHLAPVTRLFLGYEEKPLALMEQNKLVAKWGMLMQCTFCKTIGVVPLLDADQGKKQCTCGDDCKCKDKDAEGKETKEG